MTTRTFVERTSVADFRRGEQGEFDQTDLGRADPQGGGLAMARLRVIVVDDCDGKRAIELCSELRPDVVAMDMMMPVVTDAAATEHIMACCPTPIVIVSPSTNRGELFCTRDVLAAGALDVLDKPRGDDARGAARKLVGRIRAVPHPRGRPSPRSERDLVRPRGAR